MFRFIHSSDLHLGKPYGAFPEEVRAKLRSVRQDAITGLSVAARKGGAKYVLLAGDTFDAETPKPTTIRHALNAMRDAEDLTWIMMPGNHDSLAASELWRILANDKPLNVRLAVDAKPLVLSDTIVILPAPCTVRHPGRDLTEWMDGANTGDAIRIGLAHGGIRDFRSGEDLSEEGGSAIIPPDRAQRSGLSYLALGDWHGCLKISSSTWYSGTPEPDSFKPHEASGALLVSIESKTAPAQVTKIPLGSLTWRKTTLDTVEGEDLVQLHQLALPLQNKRASTLFDITVTGRAGLQDRAALENAIQQAMPDFLWHAHDLSN
jgi:DNA repair exonuclease SbcCD nuclease subunit